MREAGLPPTPPATTPSRERRSLRYPRPMHRNDTNSPTPSTHASRELFPPDEKIFVLYLQRANAASTRKTKQFPAATPDAEINSAPRPFALSLSKGRDRRKDD